MDENGYYVISKCHVTSKVVSSNPAHGGVHLIQHYVITFVGGFFSD